jgi:hypothetical protein
MSEVPSKVKLRKIVPEVPRDEMERGELLEDLQVMGCSGFLEKPWDFKDDRIVRELLDGVSNEFDNSIRGQPVKWTEECWREVYHFGKGGGGLAGRKDEYVKECFKDLPSEQDRRTSRNKPERHSFRKRKDLPSRQARTGSLRSATPSGRCRSSTSEEGSC